MVRIQLFSILPFVTFQLYTHNLCIVGFASRSIFINSRRARNLARASSFNRLEFEAQRSSNQLRHSINPHNHSIIVRHTKSLTRSLLDSLDRRSKDQRGHRSSFYNSLVVTRGPSSFSGISFHLPFLKGGIVSSRSKIRTSKFFRRLHVQRSRMPLNQSMSLMLNHCFQGSSDYLSLLNVRYSGNIPSTLFNFVSVKARNREYLLLKRRPSQLHSLLRDKFISSFRIRDLCLDRVKLKLKVRYRPFSETGPLDKKVLYSKPRSTSV